MKAALEGQYVEYVTFMGMCEAYPDWFIEEIAQKAFIDESRYCFWVSPQERSPDYYEKELIETLSVIIRKSDGSTHVMDAYLFEELYTVFNFNIGVNGGVAAFNEDVIEYIECYGGSLLDGYPKWFYEHFTEYINNPNENESYLISVDGFGYITVSERCVFLRNRFGEIRQLAYKDFIKYYDPGQLNHTIAYDVIRNGKWLSALPF